MIFLKIVEGIGVGLLSLVVGLLFMGVARKITARVHRRYGPPVLQNFIDVFKLFSKQSVSHGFAFDLGLVAGVSALLAAVVFLPMGQINLFPHNSSLIMIIYLMTMAYLGMAMGVSSSGNPNATIGIARALTMMMGYELPFAAVIFSVYIFAKTGSLTNIVAAQGGGFLNWNMVRLPFGFLAAEIALQGMLGEKPFDMAIAPAEIASGPMVELGGKYLGFGMLQHAVGIYLETGIMVDLFLGGASNIWIFVTKQFELFFIALLINAVLPRFKIEDGVKFMWKVPLLLGVIQALIVVL
ncbi:respiratory chain complex I subunit 1 family protein [Mesoaciditoga lauensis]|uniref:respiratory chain complex I subunit 1 family protein n=1 Tax=Mesoaciditoga lauensis TaxID=1495039 RepID=UPI0006924DEA|nr:complex I subunit 1 family protein [Mesoaciditoga lauensis]